jgi:uncharacterized protein YjiS (DUF1127 family)
MNAQKYEIGAPYGATEGKLPATLTGAASSIASYVKQIVVDVVRYRSFRAAEKELHALDDRMLKDIGIDRSEIRSALSSAVQQRRNYWRT